MTEQIVSDPSEVVHQHTSCEELRQQTRRVIATPRGNNLSSGPNAFKNGIHTGVIDQKIFCKLTDATKAPMCQKSTKVMGYADMQAVRNRVLKQAEWSTRSMELGSNNKRMRLDQQHRMACAVTTAHLRESFAIPLGK